MKIDIKDLSQGPSNAGFHPVLQQDPATRDPNCDPVAITIQQESVVGSYVWDRNPTAKDKLIYFISMVGCDGADIAGILTADGSAIWGGGGHHFATQEDAIAACTTHFQSLYEGRDNHQWTGAFHEVTGGNGTLPSGGLEGSIVRELGITGRKTGYDSLP